MVNVEMVNIKEFVRSQAAAFIGTAADYCIFILLADVFHLWYVISNIFSATVGATTNFFLGRYWVFQSTQKPVYRQAFRYTIVSVGSLVLNTAGLYLLTEYSGIPPLYSKIIIGILIAVCYNYVLQKYFVYK